MLPLLDVSRIPFGGPEGSVQPNWGENEYARNITKHHPTTYDEVAR